MWNSSTVHLSDLDSNTILQFGINIKQHMYISKLEKVQRKYTRLLFFKLRYERLSYSQRLEILNMIELEKRREYFDICLLHNIVHDASLVTENRPTVRVGRFSSRSGQFFNPHVPRTDYGLHRNPVTRTQLLFNRKYTGTNILSTNRLQFKNEIKNTLSF